MTNEAKASVLAQAAENMRVLMRDLQQERDMQEFQIHLIDLAIESLRKVMPRE
jgi:hypothetical protein